jgi:hypothetical protein
MRTTIGLIAIALLSGCSGSDAAPGKPGPDGTTQFTVGAFDAVALEGSDNVRVVTGATAGVVASGPADQLAKLEITVEGSTLKVSRKRDNWGMNWSSGPGVTVTVTTPGIKSAAIGGSGDMSIDRVRTASFKGSIGGSGDLDIADIEVANAEFSIAGSGNVRAAGKATETEFSLAGSGDIDATRLAGETVAISIAGSGNVRAAASKRAKISLVGSGDAEVKGTTDCAVSKIGSGEARCTR